MKLSNPEDNKIVANIPKKIPIEQIIIVSRKTSLIISKPPAPVHFKYANSFFLSRATINIVFIIPIVLITKVIMTITNIIAFVAPKNANTPSANVFDEIT